MALNAVTRTHLRQSVTNPRAYKQIRDALNASLGSGSNPPLASASFTVGAEAANVIPVTIQLVDGNGADMAEACVVLYYLSSDSAGQAVAADPGTTAIGTDGTILVEVTDDVLGHVVSEADGDIDFNITSTGTSTFYLNLVINHKLYPSTAITFA